MADPVSTSLTTTADPSVPEGFRRDPKTGQLVPLAAPMSDTDRKLASQMMTKELAANAGIAAGLQALQFGASFIDTPQDKRNEEQLAKLERLEEEGRLGLSGSERDQLNRELMDPVRALAGESRQRSEALQAASGNSQSAGALVRAGREERRDVQEAAQKAGVAIGRANLEKAAAQLDELESRVAYESNREAQRIQQGTAIIEGMAPLVGKAAAGQAQVRKATPDEIRAAHPELANVPDDELLRYYEAAQNRAKYDSLVRMTGGVSP